MYEPPTRNMIYYILMLNKHWRNQWNIFLEANKNDLHWP